MNLKKLLLSIVILLSLAFTANAAEFYDNYEFTFTNGKTSTAKLTTYECNNSACTSAKNAPATYYKGDAITCWETRTTVDQFNNCMNTYKISGDTVNLNDCQVLSNGCSGNPKVIIKYDTNSPFGYISHFFTSGDQYGVEYFRARSFNCGASICMDTLAKNIGFAKVKDAHAEIQQLNVKNIDNELLPVQIQVPVEIEETVCSAFQFANPNEFRPNAPSGYSDYSANTRVTLEIRNHNTNQLYRTESITIPIEADSCAGLAAFSWTPPTSAQNQDIKFSAETDVIDGQAANSIKDYAEVIETVHPEDLTGVCWSRAFDFTLSNKPTFNLNSGIAQVVQGEPLHAGFRSASYRQDVNTPIAFDAKFYFNNNLVHTARLNSNANLQEYFVDLTDEISNLAPGNYPVKLVTTPVNSQCTEVSDVEQTQNLRIIAPQLNDVTFVVRNDNTQPLNGVNINLQLLDASDDFVNDPSFNKNQVTGTNGRTVFTGAYNGNYKYTASKNGYVTKTNERVIGSDTTIYITLLDTNSAPVINLPSEFTKYFRESVQFNIKDYVTDANDDFADLKFTHRVVSGTASIVKSGNTYTISTTEPNTAIIEITVEDPFGAKASDRTTIRFIGNDAPSITQFRAVPDNGPVEFTTNFDVKVNDPENDQLTCTITFGDGTSKTDKCSDLDGIAHTYKTPATFNAKLSVTDGFNSPVIANEQVFVFQKEFGAPQIIFFNLDSSNGDIVPTDLTLNWKVTHPDNLPMTCTLRVNGVSKNVGCTSSDIINEYNRVGEGVFTIIARDSEGAQELRTIKRTFRSIPTPENKAPVINVFDGNPKNGVNTLTSTFQVLVSDPDGDDVSCTLNFGNGRTESVTSCNDLDNIKNTYGVGTFKAILTATDGKKSTSKDVTIVVTEEDRNNAPSIVSFVANPKTGIDTLTTTFNINVRDVDGDYLSCTINFGDGTSSQTKACNTLNGVKHTYGVGTFVATLTVSDGELQATDSETIVVTESSNNAPDILKFDANPKNGVNTLTTTFDVDVRDIDGDALTCTLQFGDGTQAVKICNQLDGIKHTYPVGTFIAKLIVSDGKTTTTKSVTIRVTREDDPNNAPEIYKFDANPKNGVDVLTSTFHIDVRDSDGDSLTCTLRFGDGNQVTDSCNDLNNIKHTYGVGTFTAILTATDGEETVSESVTIRVIKGDEPNNAPVIYNFDANPKTGFDEIDSRFRVDVRDADGDALTCTLRFGDGTQITDSCNNLDRIVNTYPVGTYVAVLTATDGDKTVTDSVTITVTQKPNSGPFIAEFDANPKTGTEVLNTSFSVRVTDVDGDRVSCTLDFGDGQDTFAADCNTLNTRKYEYRVGTYIATLTANDGEQTSTKSVTIVVDEKPNTAPFIVNFDADPRFGIEELESRFTVNVRDADGDDLICTLDFGDGTDITRSCDTINGIVNDYTIGVYTAVLTVSDGEEEVRDSVVIQVVEEPNIPPFVLRFNAVPDFGFDEITSEFEVVVLDENDDDLLCTLDFGDGTSETDECSDLNRITHDYQVGGYIATLTATDGRATVSATERIRVLRQPNRAPVVTLFDADPKFGLDQLTSTFSVNVQDADGDALTCNLAFGDGTDVNNSCDSLNGITHGYLPGTYIATLTASDGNLTAQRTVTIRVEESGMPVIDLLTLDSSNGFLAPTDLTIEWATSHTANRDMTCTLRVGNRNFAIPCDGTTTLADYNIEGTTSVTITAVDELGKMASKSVQIKLVKEENLLENIDANLIIDDTIIPGDFEFKIEIPDEPTKRRIVDVNAQIVCRGVEIKVDQIASSRKLDSSLVSSNQNDRTMYKFSLNTLNDFIANIPKDTMCTFEVVITDQYGSSQTLSEKVTFSYEEDEKRFVSIRGKGTDVINYMRSALLDGVNHGYNSIEFAVENNEAETKQLTVTVISRPLGIEFSETERISSDEIETFQIPMYISNSVEPGMYEIRFSVYDGENHQTRYSYLTVHE